MTPMTYFICFYSACPLFFMALLRGVGNELSFSSDPFFVTNRGKLRFMVYEQNMDADLFVTFLERLIQSSKKKILLILDNLRVHHSRIVKDWVEEHQDRIALFYLPAYSPDLNPDEYLNNDFKRNANSKNIPTNKKELTENTENFMSMLNNDPDRVANYFKHEKIAYAAG